MTSLLFVLSLVATDPLGPGDQYRTIKVDGRSRSYLVHVPDKYRADKATPVVLVFHGAATNAAIMVPFCGMNEKADEEGFIAVYPNGTGIGILQTFNSGGILGELAEKQPDDVKFVTALLDDLAMVANVDAKRVYATGISNGGMMCYRLAAELSDRIAAIAPVSGTMGIEEAKPKRPLPIIHFHGTADRVVPFSGPGKSSPKFLTFKSVDESLQAWVKINKCKPSPIVEKLKDKADDGTAVIKHTYAAAKGGADVILIEIEGGGHTWPGKSPPVWYLGKSTKDISANDMIWEFFQRHRLP